MGYSSRFVCLSVCLFVISESAYLATIALRLHSMDSLHTTSY